MSATLVVFSPIPKVAMRSSSVATLQQASSQLMSPSLVLERVAGTGGGAASTQARAEFKGQLRDFHARTKVPRPMRPSQGFYNILGPSRRRPSPSNTPRYWCK